MIRFMPMKPIILPLFLIGILAGCSSSVPVNTVSQELTSPDKTKKVVMFCRDAGATTPFNTQVSILIEGEKLANEQGNALIIDHGSAQLTWKPDGGLLVILDQGCRVFKREPHVKGVLIEYRQK